jgi:pimeloyl-ACP methyl ester carboxylesterase
MVHSYVCAYLAAGCGSAGRAKELQQCCPNVDVKMLNAGHCPHDEAPEIVNEALLEFLSARAVPVPA